MTRQQILTRLGAYFPVVWMDPPLEWRQAIASFQRKTESALPDGSGFQVYHPGRILPKCYRPRTVARALERLRLERARSLLRAQGVQDHVVYIWRPEFASAVDLGEWCLTVYHVDDEYSFAEVEQPLDAAEITLLRRVDQVFIHSPALWERKGHFNPYSQLVPNGVDYEAFATPVAEPRDLAPIPRPRIGYIGVLKQQLNWPLLYELAVRHPAFQFVFVGPRGTLGSDAPVVESLAALPNVHFCGARPVSELPGYTQHVDVCVLPYDDNDYTKYIYPLKLHEALAAGRPVVGTPIRTLQEFHTVIELARTVDDWSEAFARSLAPEAQSPERVAARREVARRHDWGVVTQRVAGTLASRLGLDWRESKAGLSRVEGVGYQRA